MYIPRQARNKTLLQQETMGEMPNMQTFNNLGKISRPTGENGHV